MTNFKQELGLLAVFTTLLGCAWQQSAKTEVRRSDRWQSALYSKSLNVGYIHQERMLCVPTSASMIMAFYGDRQSPRKLKVMSRGKEYIASDPFDDFSITLYRDIVRAAAYLGYHWSEQTLEDSEFGFQRGLAIIRDEISRERPVMIDLSAPRGHTIVVAGFDDAAQSINVVDPNAPVPGRYAISYGKLRLIWNEHAFEGHFRGLVVTSPRGSSP